MQSFMQYLTTYIGPRYNGTHWTTHIKSKCLSRVNKNMHSSQMQRPYLILGLTQWGLLSGTMCLKISLIKLLPHITESMWHDKWHTYQKCRKLLQCGAVITRSIFSQIFTPVRARYGVSHVDPASEWYFASVLAIIYVISYNIWPRYNGTRLYMHNKWFSTWRKETM